MTRLAEAPVFLVSCAQCGRGFDRGYRISAKRAAHHQFCSGTCRAAHLAEQAAKRLRDRFWSKVRILSADECWLWVGRLNENGYGLFDIEHHPEIASRIAYLLTHSIDPGEALVCHSCDNPRCCNGGHLWLGSHKDNMRDMAMKGRAHVTGWRGEDHPSAKLRRADVLEIRASDLPRSVLAEKFGVTGTAIYNIREGMTWRHV